MTAWRGFGVGDVVEQGGAAAARLPVAVAQAGDQGVARSPME